MKTLILTIALTGALLAQPNQLDLRQDPPTAVQSERVSSAYTGTSGATTYYYWVVTRYPIGFIVPTAPVVVGGAAALGGGNSVALGWPAMTGASSYDVLRTTTNAAPSSCTCAVVLATTGTTLTDNGGALSAWPPGGLNSAGVAQAELQINNRDAGSPYITLAVRNAQRVLNYQLGILKNGTAPSYVPSGFIQPYANQYGRLACVDSAGADCLNNNGSTSILDFGAVGDGITDDTLSIQQGLTAVGGTCKILEIPPGTYLYSAKLTLSGCSTLTGTGTLKQKTGSNVTTSLEITGANVSLLGFTIDANSAGNTGGGQLAVVATVPGGSKFTVKDVTIQNFYGLTGSTGVGLAVNGVTDAVVESSRFLSLGGNGHTSDAIYALGDQLRFVANRIDGATDTGIVCEATTNCTITGNTITNSTQGIAAGAGIALSTAYSATIIGNTITGTSGLPVVNGGLIRIYKGAGSAAGKFTVAGNVLRDNSTGGMGIWCDGASDSTISGNVLHNIADYAGGTMYGIWLDGCNNIVVNGNYLKNVASAGIVIANSDGTNVSANTIVDAARRISGASGISIQTGSDNTVVSDNIVYDSNPVIASKLMGYCVTTADTLGTKTVTYSQNFFFDGTNTQGCATGNIDLTLASLKQPDIYGTINSTTGMLTTAAAYFQPQKSFYFPNGSYLGFNNSGGNARNVITVTGDDYTRFVVADDTKGYQFDNTAQTLAWGSLTADGWYGSTYRATPVVFASLPTCLEGRMASVTDSSTNTWGDTIAGGGANKVLAYCNGSVWTVAGK